MVSVTTTDKAVDALIVPAPEVTEVEISYEDFKRDMFTLANHYMMYYHRGGDLDYDQIDQFMLKIDPTFFTPIPDMDVCFDVEMLDRVYGYLCVNCPGYPEYNDYFLLEIDLELGSTSADGMCTSCGRDDIFDDGLCAECLEEARGVTIDNCEVCQHIDYLDNHGRCRWHPVVPIVYPPIIPLIPIPQ